MDKEQLQNYIASRVAKELSDGDIVNLGIGLPTRVANFIPENIEVILQSENGFFGLGPTPFYREVVFLIVQHLSELSVVVILMYLS